MIEILVLIATLFLTKRLSKKLGKKLYIFFILLTYFSIIVTVSAHYYIVSYNDSGIATVDPHASDALAPDATIYYNIGKQFISEKNNSIIGLALSDIVTLTQRATTNLGYYIFNIIAFVLSDNPMLLLRLIKILILLLSLISLAKVWMIKYGTNYTFKGLFFITFAFWDIYLYNILNLKDGLIMSIAIFLYAQFETFTLIQPSVKYNYMRKNNNIKQIVIIGFLLLLLASLRFYLPIIFILSLIFTLFLSLNRLSTIKSSISLIIILSLISLVIYSSGLFHNIEYIINYSLYFPSWSIKGMLKFIFSPIPWQSTIKLLIPSHVIYLSFLPLIFISIMYSLKSKIKWKAILIIFSIILIGGVEQLDSKQRLRLFIIPLYASVCIEYLYNKSLKYNLTANSYSMVLSK